MGRIAQWRSGAGRSLMLGALATGMLLTGGLFTGCGSLSTGNTTTVLRIVDAVPYTGTLDFWVAGTDYVSGVAFTGVTTYGYVSTGSNSLVAFTTGTSTPIVPAQTLDMNRSTAVYTAAAAGVQGSTTTPPMFFLFTDDNTPPPPGQARIRVINLSPDAGPVTVTLGSHTVASGLTYGTASSYASIPGGTYDIAVVSSASTSSVAVRSSVAFASGHVFTIFLEGTTAAHNAAIIPQADI